MVVLIVNPAAAESLYTRGPNFSLSFNPGGGAQVGQDVNIHIKVDSANPGATKINVSCGGVSKGETSEVEFDSTWHTNDCSEGNANVNVCTKAPDDPNWQDPNCNDFGYSLSSAPSNEPQPQNNPQISCWVDSFDVWPNPATVGDTIHITGNGSCTVEIRATRVLVNGDNIYEIGGNNILNTNWNTGGVPAGNYQLKLMVAGQGDNSWNNAGSQNITLQLVEAGQPAKNNSPFATGDIIDINGNIFVIVVSGNGSVERRHIPNPDTLDALGIPRGWVDNKGWSNSELKSIHQGNDIPDVNRDTSGFAAFKAQFFPNTNPITPGEGIPNEYPVEPEQGPSGNDSNGCPIAEARLWEGGDAILSRTDMNMRKGPGVDNEIVKIVHQGSQIKVFGESACSGGSRWIKVSFGGDTGWISEVNSSGEYYLSPVGNNQPQETENPVSPEIAESRVEGTSLAQCAAPAPTEKPSWFEENFGVQAGDNRFDEGECTWYVYGQRSDVKDWIPDTGANAHTWDDSAQKADFSVDHNPKVGDIVVWEKDCGGPYSQSGHVAYVTKVFTKNGEQWIKVDEYNWNNDHSQHFGTEYKVRDSSCMSFIHQYKNSSEQDASSQSNSQTPTSKKSLLEKIKEWFGNLFD